MSDIRLDGLCADNPLAFMAALGALITADRMPRDPGAVTLRWEDSETGWHPVLAIPGALDRDCLLDILHTRLSRCVTEEGAAALKAADRHLRDAKAAKKKADEAFKAAVKKDRIKKGSPEYSQLLSNLVEPAQRTFEAADDIRRRAADQGSSPDRTTALGPTLKVPPSAFQAFVLAAARSSRPTDRRVADLAAGFGSELIHEDDILKPTVMSKQNGNSGKNMLADIATIMQTITTDRLGAALFHPWDYRDEKCSLGWDPRDVRPFAHQAIDPAEGSVTMHGANLLAYEGLALLPTAIRGRGLKTTGTERIGRSEYLTWPVWSVAASLDVVRSIVSLKEVHRETPDREHLRRMGIAEVFRSEHFTVNKKSLRLRPARAV